MATDKINQMLDDLKPLLKDYNINYYKFDWKLSRGIEEMFYKVTDSRYDAEIINFAEQVLSPETFHRIMEKMINEYTISNELKESRLAIWQLIK